VPRTANFLFSRNRLRVAVSSARALTHVICTDELLDARARDIEEMKLIATLYAYVEAARTSTGRPLLKPLVGQLPDRGYVTRIRASGGAHVAEPRVSFGITWRMMHTVAPRRPTRVR
jgi:hypothetical protein